MSKKKYIRSRRSLSNPRHFIVAIFENDGKEFDRVEIKDSWDFWCVDVVLGKIYNRIGLVFKKSRREYLLIKRFEIRSMEGELIITGSINSGKGHEAKRGESFEFTPQSIVIAFGK